MSGPVPGEYGTTIVIGRGDNCAAVPVNEIAAQTTTTIDDAKIRFTILAIILWFRPFRLAAAQIKLSATASKTWLPPSVKHCYD